MWNQHVIVETKAGVAGVLAAEYTSQQPSDGSTLLMAHINSPPWRPACSRSCATTSSATRADRDGRVTPNLLIATRPEGADRAGTRRPVQGAAGAVSFGSAGQGSGPHLALEMFKLQAKVDALHVPYKGSGPLLTDLIGGQIRTASRP